jgi:hypothetical protein
VISIQTTMGTIWSTFEVGVSMKKQATGGADKMYIKLWIAAGRCGVRRVRGLAPESQRTQTRIEPCQAKIARPAPDQGEIGNVSRICCNWLVVGNMGVWMGKNCGLRDSPRECVRWRRHR